MTIEIEVDEDLLEKAREYAGISETSALMNEALSALIKRQAIRGLIALGGSQPNLKHIPRRRPTNPR